MVSRSNSAEGQRQKGWLPPLRAVWSLCWRLSMMLFFLVGALCLLLIDHWWAAFGCIIGFIVAAVVIRRMSIVEHQESSGDSIVFL
jgi:hypothetical protein